MAGILFRGEPDIYPEHNMVYRGVKFILDSVYTDSRLATRRADQLEMSGRKTDITIVDMLPESVMQHLDSTDVVTGHLHKDGRVTRTYWVWKTERTHIGHRRDHKQTKPKPKRISNKKIKPVKSKRVRKK